MRFPGRLLRVCYVRDPAEARTRLWEPRGHRNHIGGKLVSGKGSRYRGGAVRAWMHALKSSSV
jgi:hypothetical protein